MSPGHPRFTLSCIENLKNFRGMDNINIKCMDFRESIKENPNDWLYLDPPYALENNKNNLYGIKGNMHKFFPHEDLFALLKNRDKWLLSYNDSEYIRDMYKDYKIFPLHYAYGMSKDKKSKEILIRSRS
jgi:DNA adenine methylase